MEQKTEASQAVGDLEALAKRLDRIHTACTDDRPKQAVGEMIHAMISMSEWSRVRAALRAQPAPTEAPNFCATCGKRLHAGSIHTCTPPAYAETPAHECIARENDTLVCTACGTTSPTEWVVLNPTEAAQGGQIGWVNTKYGNFIPLSGLASTKRNSELLASRELIAVYGASQLSGNSGELANKQLFENIEELQPPGNTGELAQGEDSARLDAADLATIEEATKVLESAAKHNEGLGRTVFAHVQRDRAVRLRAILDRARASAETGGVK